MRGKETSVRQLTGRSRTPGQLMQSSGTLYLFISSASCKGYREAVRCTHGVAQSRPGFIQVSRPRQPPILFSQKNFFCKPPGPSIIKIIVAFAMDDVYRQQTYDDGASKSPKSSHKIHACASFLSSALSSGRLVMWRSRKPNESRHHVANPGVEFFLDVEQLGVVALL